MMSTKMTVFRPIEVPCGDHCWKYSDPVVGYPIICDHFTNEGGHSFCEMFKTSLREDGDGVIKCESCLNCQKLPERKP